MTLDIDIGDSADALTINQLRDALDGTYWSDGWDATTGSGDLEVDIESGEGSYEGSTIETGSTETVDLEDDGDPDDPLKAVIYVDEDENVETEVGDPAPAAPDGETRFRTWDPAPPADVDGVVVAEVWLGADASEVTSEDIRDRRVGNESVENVGTPSGIITMWSGDSTDVPDGWTLCDGSDGTPDLTDRFVVGAGGDYDADDTGGEETVALTESEMPSHDHGVDDPGHTHDVPRFSNDEGTSQVIDPVPDAGNDSVETSSSSTGISINQTGGGESHENRPPYYALAYIMKE